MAVIARVVMRKGTITVMAATSAVAMLVLKVAELVKSSGLGSKPFAATCSTEFYSVGLRKRLLIILI